MWIGILGLIVLIAVNREWLTIGKKNTKWAYILGVVLIGFALWQGNVFSSLGMGTSPTDVILSAGVGSQVVNVAQPSSTQQLCIVDKTTATISTINAYDQSTAVTGGGQSRLFIRKAGESTWIDKGYFANSVTTTLSPYDQYRIVYQANSTSASTGAYPVETIGTVPCSGTLALEGKVCQYDTSPTVTTVNNDGITKNSATGADDLSANTNYDLSMKFKASSQKCLGNINHPSNGNILCFQYNSTEYTTVALSNQQQTYVPQSLTAVAGKVASCYYSAPIADTNAQEYNLHLVTGSSYAGGTNISYSLWDTTLGLNTYTLDTILGVQDNKNTDMGYLNNITGGFIYDN